jgi:formamidopyrimidine-DNA glycosylase
MPEAPELEVVREYLTDRASGAEVTSAEVIKPSVLRSLNGDMTRDIVGKTLESIQRRGKFLLFRFSEERLLAVNPMLTGAIQYCAPKERMFKRVCFRLSISNGCEMRYLDDKQMGIVYYVREEQLDQVPRLGEQDPDVLDDYSFDEFKERLRPFHGEIKGILTRGRVISGIGNAYSDEILFAAGLYPFRKRKSLNPDELRCLYEKSRSVVEDAIPILRERMGDNMHTKVRDILQVHNKGGEPCPRCGNTISQLTANKLITSYCRKCQPGMLLRN